MLNRHKLAPVWDLARLLIDPICTRAGEKSLPGADLDGVQSYIRQLDTYDPIGESFRYSTTKRGAPVLSEELQVINIRVFAERMEQLADYLGGMESWISGLLDCARTC